MTNTTQAENFFNQFSFQTENNGWTGTGLKETPDESEAKELTGEDFKSSWGWEFPDGSKLFLIPGQMCDTVLTFKN